MARRRIVISSAADQDTADIVTYLANEAGRAIAARYIGLFENLYDRLTEYPDSGAFRPSLGAGVRIGIVSPFIVIYDYTPDIDTLTVLRIVHGNRRITAKLLSR